MFLREWIQIGSINSKATWISQGICPIVAINTDNGAYSKLGNSLLSRSRQWKVDLVGLKVWFHLWPSFLLYLWDNGMTYRDRIESGTDFSFYNKDLNSKYNSQVGHTYYFEIRNVLHRHIYNLIYRTCLFTIVLVNLWTNQFWKRRRSFIFLWGASGPAFSQQVCKHCLNSRNRLWNTDVVL